MYTKVLLCQKLKLLCVLDGLVNEDFSLDDVLYDLDQVVAPKPPASRREPSSDLFAESPPKSKSKSPLVRPSRYDSGIESDDLRNDVDADIFSDDIDADFLADADAISSAPIVTVAPTSSSSSPSTSFSRGSLRLSRRARESLKRRSKSKGGASTSKKEKER